MSLPNIFPNININVKKILLRSLQLDPQKFVQRNLVKGYYFITLNGTYFDASKLESSIDRYFDFENYNYIFPGMSKKEYICRYTYDPKTQNCLVSDFSSYKFILNTELRFLSPDQVLDMREEILDYLNTEYKIHLQPKPEFLEYVLNTLIDLQLKNKLTDVYIIKVLPEYDPEIIQKGYPIIVVYPYLGRNRGDTRGAESTLETLLKAFQGEETLIGLNVTPKYNKKLNELIYIAGGDRDIKTEYSVFLPLHSPYLFDKDLIFYKTQKDISLLF